MRLIIAVAAVVLGLGACSGDDVDDAAGNKAEDSVSTASSSSTTVGTETLDPRCPDLSVGPHPLVEVPDVEGMSYDDAAALLFAVPLCPVLTQVQDSAAIVVGQEPAAGGEVPSEGGVLLRIETE